MAVRRLREFVRIQANLRHVKIVEGEATNLEGVTPGSIDLVVINSVVQYFPNLAYLQNVLTGAAYPRYLCWASLVAFFAEDLLRMATWGGMIVSCARMAGFRLLRNTYNPLAATTIAEFWNRYYFYYKELLVDHIFFPVFFRCFRKYRRLRVFFATFIAACVGNLLFHFMRDIHFIVDMGFARALIGEESHAFYTLVLALGIALSQMRPRRVATPATSNWLRGHLLPGIRVAAFFCLLHVFDAPLDRIHTIGQHGRFLLHLFGLDLWV